jgi:hypothetical protein
MEPLGRNGAGRRIRWSAGGGSPAAPSGRTAAVDARAKLARLAAPDKLDGGQLDGGQLDGGQIDGGQGRRRETGDFQKLLPEDSSPEAGASESSSWGRERTPLKWTWSRPVIMSVVNT